MENFTLREMRVGEMLMGNRSVSVFCRLLLYRFTKISKYGFCTAQNRNGKFHVERDACRRNVDGKIVVLLSSVVYYFGDLLKSVNMAFVRHKTFICL